MAEKELRDYLTEKTATVDVTMTLAPRVAGGPAYHRLFKNEVIHMAVDGSAEERIDLSGGNWIAYIEAGWDNFQASDAGTIMDMYANASYGNGQINSWYLEYPDGHTYVVRFAMPFEQRWVGRLYSHKLLLRVLGYKTGT